MNAHEKIAARNIRGAFNFEVGGMYNAYLDGETEFPTIDEMKQMVYDCAIHDLYGYGCCMVGQAPRAMRFAGKKFCMEYLDKLFAEDEDAAVIPWGKHEGEHYVEW